MTFYRRDLPHVQKDNRAHFVTFVTHRRQVLPEWARTVVLRCCHHDNHVRYDLHVVVVMPDHVHLAFTPLKSAQRLTASAVIMKGIKGASAHVINRRRQCKGPVWQTESFDHVVRCEESLYEKVDYVRQNPVRRGLVQVPNE